MRKPGQSQFSGCLLGECLGDAAGFVVEGAGPDICGPYVRTVLRPVTSSSNDGMQRLARGPFGFGQYSDDSQLARELLQSYVAVGRFDPADYAVRIAAIFAEDRIVGRGRATEDAARRLAGGVHWEDSGTPPPAAGNGSAMRAGPIGLMFYDDPQRLVEAAHDQGRITHKDRRSSAGAIAIAGSVATALVAEDIDVQEFTSQLAGWVRPFDTALADGLELMPEWVQMPPEQAVTLISRTGLEPTYSDGWQGISPFVTGSVLWSIYSFLRSPDDYWESICTAIAVGGDVDTTAAMTGAISGARVGTEGIPESLVPLVNDNGTWGHEELVALAEEAYAIKNTVA